MLYVSQEYDALRFGGSQISEGSVNSSAICDGIFMPLNASSCSIPICRSANTSVLPTVSAGSLTRGCGSFNVVRFLSVGPCDSGLFNSAPLHNVNVAPCFAAVREKPKEPKTKSSRIG